MINSRICWRQVSISGSLVLCKWTVVRKYAYTSLRPYKMLSGYCAADMLSSHMHVFLWPSSLELWSLKCWVLAPVAFTVLPKDMSEDHNYGIWSQLIAVNTVGFIILIIKYHVWDLKLFSSVTSGFYGYIPWHCFVLLNCVAC